MTAVFTKRHSIRRAAAVALTAVAWCIPFASAEGRQDRVAAAAEVAQTPDAATSLRMRGRIEKFETTTRVLVLSTAAGSVELPVASGARVRQGHHRIAPDALEELAGYRAAVRYSESGGVRTAESIHVFNKLGEGDRDALKSVGGR